MLEYLVLCMYTPSIIRNAYRDDWIEVYWADKAHKQGEHAHSIT